MSAAVSTLIMPGCTGPPVSNGSPPLHRETINEHCVEAAPCPHCHCRTHILQGVLTASLRNYHCTSKAQPLKGQSCSKLMLTNFTWALYFTYSPSLLTSLCIFWTSKRVTCMADKNYCRDGVFYQLCFAKENFKEKCSVDVCWNSPYFTNPGFLSPAFLCCFLWPLTVLLYDEVWKELHSGLLHISRSTALSYWDDTVTSDSLV